MAYSTLVNLLSSSTFTNEGYSFDIHRSRSEIHDSIYSHLISIPVNNGVYPIPIIAAAKIPNEPAISRSIHVTHLIQPDIPQPLAPVRLGRHEATKPSHGTIQEEFFTHQHQPQSQQLLQDNVADMMTKNLGSHFLCTYVQDSSHLCYGHHSLRSVQILRSI